MKYQSRLNWDVKLVDNIDILGNKTISSAPQSISIINLSKTRQSFYGFIFNPVPLHSYRGYKFQSNTIEKPTFRIGNVKNCEVPGEVKEFKIQLDNVFPPIYQEQYQLNNKLFWCIESKQYRVIYFIDLLIS